MRYSYYSGKVLLCETFFNSQFRLFGYDSAENTVMDCTWKIKDYAQSLDLNSLPLK